MKHHLYAFLFLCFLVFPRSACAQQVGVVLQLDGSILFQVDHIILNPKGKIAYLELIKDIPITVGLNHEPVLLLEEKCSYLKLQESLPKSLHNNFELNANSEISYFNGYTINYNFKDQIDKIGAAPVEYNFKNKIDKIGTYEISYKLKGKIDRVGNLNIEYNLRNQIDKIGNQNISYNFRNQIDKIGETAIEYDLHYRVEKIGKLQNR